MTQTRLFSLPRILLFSAPVPVPQNNSAGLTPSTYSNDETTSLAPTRRNNTNLRDGGTAQYLHRQQSSGDKNHSIWLTLKNKLKMGGISVADVIESAETGRLSCAIVLTSNKKRRAGNYWFVNTTVPSEASCDWSIHAQCTGRLDTYNCEADKENNAECQQSRKVARRIQRHQIKNGFARYHWSPCSLYWPWMVNKENLHKWYLSVSEGWPVPLPARTQEPPEPAFQKCLDSRPPPDQESREAPRPVILLSILKCTHLPFPISCFMKWIHRIQFPCLDFVFY
jgi:hypothetical protein